MPAKVYTQKEAKITPIKKKTLAVIGYGSQGHAHALNLKDSGCKVIIGLYKGSKSIRVAKRHGFEVMEVADAVQQAGVIMIGVPDMKQAEVYESEIKPNLSKGKTLLFTHGFAIHFGLIKPPRGVSVIMVAPKGPGHIVRSQYKEGKGVPSLDCSAQRFFQRFEEDRPCVGGGIGRDSWYFTDHFQGGNRDGFVWRASSSLRWSIRLGRGWFRDSRRGWLCARDGLFRVLARTQAYCRSDDRIGCRRYEVFSFRNGEVRWRDPWTEGHQRQRKEGHEVYPEGNSVGQIRP